LLSGDENISIDQHLIFCVSCGLSYNNCIIIINVSSLHSRMTQWSYFFPNVQVRPAAMLYFWRYGVNVYEDGVATDITWLGQSIMKMLASMIFTPLSK